GAPPHARHRLLVLPGARAGVRRRRRHAVSRRAAWRYTDRRRRSTDGRAASGRASARFPWRRRAAGSRRQVGRTLMTRFAIIEAPSPLGRWPGGVDRPPEGLLQIGLARALDARRDQRVEPPDYDPVRESTTAMLNPRGLAEYSPRLADAIGRVVDGGEIPVVVGGGCSILVGCTLALPRARRPGLLLPVAH